MHGIVVVACLVATIIIFLSSITYRKRFIFSDIKDITSCYDDSNIDCISCCTIWQDDTCYMGTPDGYKCKNDGIRSLKIYYLAGLTTFAMFIVTFAIWMSPYGYTAKVSKN